MAQEPEESGQQELPPSELITVDETEPLTLTDALDLGLALEFLRRAARHHSQYEIGEEDEGKILGTLTTIQGVLASSDLESSVTSQVAQFRDNLIENYDPSDKLDVADRDELEQNAITWQHLLQEDLSRQRRIPVENTGLLDVDRLIESPDDLVSKAVWNWLDDRPKSDLREACRTLVIGSGTASVILSLRAVEHCLREWYEHEMEQELDAAWGQVLDQLMEEFVKDDKRNDTVLTQLSDLPPVLSNLYYLKEKRNEVNHPERSPDPQEARRTLMIVAATISDIHSEIQPDITGKGQQILRKYFDTDMLHEFWRSTTFENDTHELFYNAILNMEDIEEDGAPVSALKELGEEIGLEPSEIQSILHDLMKSGRVYQPTEDHFRTT